MTLDERKTYEKNKFNELKLKKDQRLTNNEGVIILYAINAIWI